MESRDIRLDGGGFQTKETTERENEPEIREGLKKKNGG